MTSGNLILFGFSNALSRLCSSSRTHRFLQLMKITIKKARAVCIFMNVDDIMNLIAKGTECAVGFWLGYEMCRKLADGVGEVSIRGVRIHHYIVSLGALLTNSLFLRCFLLGCGMEDIPDLIDDVSPPDDHDIHIFTDNLRSSQDKPPKWS